MNTTHAVCSRLGLNVCVSSCDFQAITQYIHAAASQTGFVPGGAVYRRVVLKPERASSFIFYVSVHLNVTSIWTLQTLRRSHWRWTEKIKGDHCGRAAAAWANNTSHGRSRWCRQAAAAASVACTWFSSSVFFFCTKCKVTQLIMGEGEWKHKLPGHCYRMYLLPGTGLAQNNPHWQALIPSSNNSPELITLHREGLIKSHSLPRYYCKYRCVFASCSTAFNLQLCDPRHSSSKVAVALQRCIYSRSGADGSWHESWHTSGRVTRFLFINFFSPPHTVSSLEGGKQGVKPQQPPRDL